MVRLRNAGSSNALSAVRFAIRAELSLKRASVLSSLRPEAIKVLEEIASAYHLKFDRPLPITSLVRPDEYQHKLSKVNPNATRIETPPSVVRLE